jgi:hypothetical protein
MKVNPRIDLVLTINSIEVAQVTSFTYLDRIITIDGALRTSTVASRTQMGPLCS